MFMGATTDHVHLYNTNSNTDNHSDANSNVDNLVCGDRIPM